MDVSMDTNSNEVVEVSQQNPQSAAPAAPVAAEAPVENNIVKMAEEEYVASGKLSDETYAAIEKSRGLKREEVDLIIEGRVAKAEAEAAKLRQDLLSVIGGDEKLYDTMALWAKDNLPPEEIDLFDRTLQSGDSVAIKQQLKYLKSQYDGSNVTNNRHSASTGRPAPAALMRIGGAASSDGGRYRNVADLRQAMRDPRYLSDANYTADLQAKAARGFYE